MDFYLLPIARRSENLHADTYSRDMGIRFRQPHQPDRPIQPPNPHRRIRPSWEQTMAEMEQRDKERRIARAVSTTPLHGWISNVDAEEPEQPMTNYELETCVICRATTVQTTEVTSCYHQPTFCTGCLEIYKGISEYSDYREKMKCPLCNKHWNDGSLMIPR